MAKPQERPNACLALIFASNAGHADPSDFNALNFPAVRYDRNGQLVFIDPDSGHSLKHEDLRVIVLRRTAKDGEVFHDLPGGKPLIGQGYRQGLRDELWQEVRMTAGRLDYMGAMPHPVPARALKGIHRKFYLAIAAAGLLQNGEPHEHDVLVVPPAEALKLLQGRIPSKMRALLAGLAPAQAPVMALAA